MYIYLFDYRFGYVRIYNRNRTVWNCSIFYFSISDLFLFVSSQFNNQPTNYHCIYDLTQNKSWIYNITWPQICNVAHNLKENERGKWKKETRKLCLIQNCTIS